MQVVSYFSALYKRCYNFLKWKIFKPPTGSLDSPHTGHGEIHFHLHLHGNLMSTLTLVTPMDTPSVAHIEVATEQTWHFTIMTVV